MRGDLTTVRSRAGWDKRHCINQLYRCGLVLRGLAASTSCRSSSTTSAGWVSVLPRVVNQTRSVMKKLTFTRTTYFTWALFSGLALPRAAFAEYSTIWQEGFDGVIPTSWTVVAQYGYSIARNHGTYTGAGAALAGPAASQMWRSVGARPLAECHVSAWFCDLNGGWKSGTSGTCGVTYRQTLGLTPLNGGTGSMLIEHPFYSSPSYATYNVHTIGQGGLAWSAYGNRWTATTCEPAWIYLETTINPGDPGASPVGTFTVKATDGAVRPRQHKT